MNSNQNKTKKIKNLIIISVLLLVILLLIVGLILFSDTNVAKRRVEKINSLEKEYSDYIMPLNRSDLMNKYRGELSKETIYTLMYEFALDTLPELREKGIDNPEEFFDKNKEYIYIKTGIENVEDYKKIIDKIKKLPEELVLSKTEIKEESVENINGLTSAVLIVYYNDNIQKTEINITLENHENKDRTSIKFN